jgi:sigma-B regulation protein RsbU (phosphoserine phosphatase)
VKVDVVSRFDSIYVADDGSVDHLRPVLAVFNARPSRLNALIFASLGELRETYLAVFILILIAFLIIEAAALATGVVLTRQITRAINDLYLATRFVQAGDLSHRVRIERRDQLGDLGVSFNLMTSSISGLIEEQAQRHLLESEISIAREVQEQLFPRAVPSVPGVEIAAICKAARSVSRLLRFHPAQSHACCHRNRGHFGEGNFGSPDDGKIASGAAKPGPCRTQRNHEPYRTCGSLEPTLGQEYQRRPLCHFSDSRI